MMQYLTCTNIISYSLHEAVPSSPCEGSLASQSSVATQSEYYCNTIYSLLSEVPSELFYLSSIQTLPYQHDQWMMNLVHLIVLLLLSSHVELGPLPVFYCLLSSVFVSCSGRGHSKRRVMFHNTTGKRAAKSTL